MKLFMQGGTTGTTLQALERAATGAVGGVAHFAWATRAGLAALVGLRPTQELLADGQLELVIGTDAITDFRALQYVRGLSTSSQGLLVRFFLHREKRIFHPKTALFWDEGGHGRLLVGSGNLTDWGLRQNWEIGAVIDLQPSETDAVLAEMRQWEAANADRLLAPSDSRVDERVASNKPFERSAVATEAVTEAENEEKPESPKERWLLVELTKGRGDYNQTSMPHVIAVDFFGFSAPGVNIDLAYIDDDGNYTGVEHRWLGSKASINFAFDLKGANGAQASASGEPPIGLFVRGEPELPVAYTIVSPKDPGYSSARELLDSLTRIPKSGRLKRAYVPRSSVEAIWPDCSLLHADLRA